MQQPATCGAGLAAHAVLPAKLGELVAAVADNLEAHLRSLDPADDETRAERDAYLSIAGQHRGIAERLAAVAREMAAQGDLPMGRHDEALLGAPEAVDAFRRYLDRERELAALLQGLIEVDQRLLR